MIKRFVSSIIIISMMLVMASCGTTHSNLKESNVKEFEPEPLIINDNESSVTHYDNGYTKFQDRMSMDWDFIDHEFLLKIATYKGGSAEQRAYTILVTLNRMLDENYPNTIHEVVLDELYNVDGITSYDFEGIITDDVSRQGMELVLYKKIDNSYGSTEYINFK